MNPVQLILLTAIVALVAWVGWSWIHVGSKYPLRPKDEWAGHTCGECRFRDLAPCVEGRCNEARAPFAGWYVQPDHPACDVWQHVEEKSCKKV